MEKAYRNVGFLFLLFIPLTFWGFYSTYFVPAPRFASRIDLSTHVHALTASLWIALLIAQPLLMRNNNFTMHRTLGKVSVGVFAALILSFIPQMIKEYGRGLFPLNASFDVVLLMLFFGLALRHRRDVSVHMRYMIAIALIFIGPTLGRIIGITMGWGHLGFLQIPYLIVLLILIVLTLWDKQEGRKFQPYLVALISFSVYLLALYAIDVNLS